jgi:hypothetical protein
MSKVLPLMAVGAIRLAAYVTERGAAGKCFLLQK